MSVEVSHNPKLMSLRVLRVFPLPYVTIRFLSVPQSYIEKKRKEYLKQDQEQKELYII